MKYIRQHYKVPAKRGGHVQLTPDFNDGPIQEGVIVGSRGPYLRVRINGQKEIGTYHPRWNIKYLD